MATGQAFPLFVRAEYDSSGSGFREFEADALRATQSTKRQFEASLSEIQSEIRRALTLSPSAKGALNFDTASMRRAAQDADALAIAARSVAQAAGVAARETGDTTRATQLYVQAARAAAIEAEGEARALMAKATTYERLQAELDKATASTRGFASQSSRATGAITSLAGSQRQLSQTSVMAGQQLQDVFIQIQGGQRVSTALAQQIPQLTFAFSHLDGRVGAVARTLSGPWGLAVAGAAYVAGTLIDKLLEADKATKAAEFSSYGLGNAQTILGGAMDLTTGKINTQSEALKNLARAQILAGQIESRKKIADLRGTLTAAGKETESSREYVKGVLGTNRPASGYAWVRRSTDSARIVDAMLKGDIKTDVAITRLEALGKAGKITEDKILSLATSMASIGVEQENLKLFESSKRLLDGKATDEDRALLLKPAKARAARKSGSTDPEKAAETIARKLAEANEKAIALRGQFDRMPGDIDRSNNALIDAEQIIDEMDRKLKDGKLSEAQRKAADETKRIAAEAKALAEAAPNRPMADVLVATQETYRAQQLLLEGRIGEHDLLQDTLELARLIGAESLEQIPALIEQRKITQEQLDNFYNQNEALRAQERAMRRLDRAGQSVGEQLREIDGIRGSIETAIADAPKGVGAAIKNFAQDITTQFRQLSARQLTERLFGDVFDDLEKELQSLSPMGRATREYVEGTSRATMALAEFTGRLKGATAAVAANDNPNAVGIGVGLPMLRGPLVQAIQEIVVTAPTWRKRSLEPSTATLPEGLSAADLYQTTFTRLFERYLGKGSPLARDLGSILQGYLQAGPVGASINGLSALFGESSGIGRALKNLSKSLPEVAMIMEAQSAIGSLLGNDEIKNGGILNHLIGPFLTRIFGSAKRGSATISGNADDFAVAVRGNTG